MAEVLRAAHARERLETELLHSERLSTIGQTTAGFGHDLKNLVTILNGVSARLLETLDVDHPSRAYAEMLDSAGRQSEKLVRLMLDFSRPGTGVFDVLDLNTVVSDVQRLGRNALHDGVDLALDLAEPLPPVRGEYVLLHQAIVNLVLNASDSMPNGGRVLLRTGATGRPFAEEPGSLPPGDVEPHGCWRSSTAVSVLPRGCSDASSSRL